MEKKILLVGCGNIGSRHLQALTKLPWSSDIDIVDPNKNAQNLAKKRLEEINYKKSDHTFSWHESIKGLMKSDLAIIATHSTGRVDMINQLLKQEHSRFLVEKIVCQSSEEYDVLLKNMESFNAKGWINTARRYFSPYLQIKQIFKNSEPIHLTINGGNMGLGSNAIHFFDLFCWICDDYALTLKGDFLYDKIFPNKRGENLMEFAGTIIGSTQKGSFISISFLPIDNLPLIIRISGKSGNYLIDETNQRMFDLLDQNETYSHFQIEHTSSTTSKIAQDIISKDDCFLPTLKESSFVHKELFRIFNQHIKKLTNEKITLCPIT